MATYFIRQNGGGAQGPFEEVKVAAYITQGKVRAGMEISPDGQRWVLAEEHPLFASTSRHRPPPEPAEEVEVISAAPERPARRPARRPRPAPASGGGGKAVLAVVGLLVVGGIGYIAMKGGDDRKSRPDASAAVSSGAIISADDLSSAYGANEIAADGRFKGRTVTVSGEVVQVGKDAFIQKPFLILSTRRWPRVWCYLTEKAAERAATFTGGERVGIEGVCRGLQLFKTDDGERQYVLIEDTLAQSAVSVPGTPARAQITKAEFKKRIGWDGFLLNMTKAEFLSKAGNPSRTQTIGGLAYWYYPCADGTVQVILNSFILENGRILSEGLNDY